MPEGPEVRRSADQLHEALAGRPIADFQARTKEARRWLEANAAQLAGRHIERVVSHGKHILGYVEGGYFFHSHFMMWGKWLVVAPEAPEVLVRDRRERARIVVPEKAALLYSAPKFDVGPGDPYAVLPVLAALGPDVLPYEGAFDRRAFAARLRGHPGRPIGAALLDQTICAGLGNYLRAEILWACRLDPWRPVARLDDDDFERIAHATEQLARRAYETGGRTVPDDVQARMLREPGFVYRTATPWNTRHGVFRRTNLPCTRCGDTIRQKRQVTHQYEDGGEKTRIIYYCPTCQQARAPEPPPRSTRERVRRHA